MALTTANAFRREDDSDAARAAASEQSKRDAYTRERDGYVSRGLLDRAAAVEAAAAAEGIVLDGVPSADEPAPRRAGARRR